MINKLAIKNLKSNSKDIVSFILSNAMMYAVLFVMTSLTKNQYVLTRHPLLIDMMQFGVFIVSIVDVIFTVYSQRFIIKKRFQELFLYEVLGLEKKHIIKMLFIESAFIFVFTAILAVVTGYVLGIFSFLFLRKLLNITLDAFNIFNFEVTSLAFTIFIMVGSFLLNLAINIFHIAKKTPTELKNYQNEPEKEPKTKTLSTILGFVALVLGYAISLFTNNPFNAIFLLLVAILLVIIGTYLLFTSISIFILKLERKNKAHYYKVKNFLTISTLIYRIKSNAISLATITILCSAVIISTSTVLTIGQTTKNMIIDNDYVMTGILDKNKLTLQAIDNKISEIDNKFAPSLSMDKSYFISYSITCTIDESGVIKPLDSSNSQDYSKYTMLTITTKDFYEKAFNEKLQNINSEQIFFGTNSNKTGNLKQITLFDKTYQTIPTQEKGDKRMVTDKTFLIVDNFDTFKHLVNSFSKIENKPSQIYNLLSYNIFINQGDTDIYNYLKTFSEQNSLELYDKKGQIDFLQEFSGGFLFLGVLISIVFTIITSLVLYYKQTAEGNEDKKRYDILKKLGISEKMAQFIIKSQMKIVFLMPIVVAVVHNIIASKIMYNILRLFGLLNYSSYFNNLILISSIYGIIYFISYMLAQKSYKDIIW